MGTGWHGLGWGEVGGVKNKFCLKCFLDDFKCYKAFFLWKIDPLLTHPPPPYSRLTSTQFFKVGKGGGGTKYFFNLQQFVWFEDSYSTPRPFVYKVLGKENFENCLICFKMG